MHEGSDADEQHVEDHAGDDNPAREHHVADDGTTEIGDPARACERTGDERERGERDRVESGRRDRETDAATRAFATEPRRDAQTSPTRETDAERREHHREPLDW